QRVQCSGNRTRRSEECFGAARLTRNKHMRKPPSKHPAASPVVAVRNIAPLSRLILFVRAGGRCEFDGCKKFLLEHHVTLTEGNFAQMAHIVAFQPDGPRGNGAHRPENINEITNLM